MQQEYMHATHLRRARGKTHDLDAMFVLRR
jgi:hypothetical protein